MDFKDIKQIVELMKHADLMEFEIKDKDLKLRISRQNELQASQQMAVAPVQMASSPAASPSAPAGGGAEPTVKVAAEEAGIHLIKSPMVGTFYRANSPDSAPFAEVGAVINNDSVVCIIEAMKVMNEIQAETKGKITEVLVENGDPVEFGQPLFKVKVS